MLNGKVQTTGLQANVNGDGIHTDILDSAPSAIPKVHYYAHPLVV